MKIDMMPHSGVIAYDFLHYPYPVVGWCTYPNSEGGVVLMPMVLERGRMRVLDDASVAYDLVGAWSEMWLDLLGYHNGTGEAGGVRPPANG